MKLLALDLGFTRILVFGVVVCLVKPSIAPVGDGRSERRMTGVRMAKPPLRIQTDADVFHVVRALTIGPTHREHGF